MPHLIEPWPQSDSSADASLPALLQYLQDAHHRLREPLIHAWQQADPEAERIGITLKRIPVDVGDQRVESIQELVNQLATLERLVDAVEWFSEQPDWQSATVRICHPTTSSLLDEEDDADLLLESSLGRAIIEVFDEVRPSGANRKVPRTQSRFRGLLERHSGVARRFFIAIPQERAEYLERGTTRNYGFQRCTQPAVAGTAVMEWSTTDELRPSTADAN